MSTIRIVPLTDALTHPGLDVARLPEAWLHHGDLLFVVLTGGFFGGQRLNSGDLLVCRGDIDEGDTVIINPRGRGTARLGTIDGTTVKGASGEPCSGARWVVAGRLFAVVQSTTALAPHRVPMQLAAAPAPTRVNDTHTRAWRAIARNAHKVTEPTRRQLSLFAARLAA